MTPPLQSALRPASAWDWLKAPDPAGRGELAGLRWHPSQIADCLAARDARPVPSLDAEALRELRDSLVNWGADAASLDAAEKLGDPATRIVVAGQQPGLLAGPILVVYKTLGAVALARELARKHPGRDFVPVFWVAGEDHDFEEVRHASWPAQGPASAENPLASFSLPAGAIPPGAMAGAAPTGGATLDDLIAGIESASLPTDFRPQVLAFLRQAYGDAIDGHPGDLETGFCALLLRLLRGTGLVIVSPRMQWLRRRATPLFLRELAEPGRSTAAVNARGDAVEAAGLPRPLRRPDGSLNFFRIDDAGRRWTLRIDEADPKGPLLSQLAGGAGGAVADDASDKNFVDRQALAEEIDAFPDRFSANVVSRPMLQDSALATVAQVIGPGEAAYLELVEAVYADFGVFVPARWPRSQALLVEPRVERHLAKQSLTLDQALACAPAELADLVLRRSESASLLSRIESLAARQREELAALAGELGADPALAASAAKLAEAMEKGYAKLTERLLAARRRDEGGLMQAMQAVAASLRPAGQPQERLLNPVVPFAVNYGLDWPARLAKALSADPAAPLQVFRMTDLMRDET